MSAELRAQGTEHRVLSFELREEYQKTVFLIPLPGGVRGGFFNFQKI